MISKRVNANAPTLERSPRFASTFVSDLMVMLTAFLSSKCANVFSCLVVPVTNGGECRTKAVMSLTPQPDTQVQVPHIIAYSCIAYSRISKHILENSCTFLHILASYSICKNMQAYTCKFLQILALSCAFVFTPIW